MKLGSLFDGSGGFPLAATMCGIIPVWASEVEPYPIAVTRSRFPKMRHLGDVSKVNGADMNTCSRSDGEKAEKPVWKVKSGIVHTDYADGSADTKTIQRASWCCPICDWFVGDQVEVFGRKHNQQKKNFCDRCGQMIDWESVEKEEL